MAVVVGVLLEARSDRDPGATGKDVPASDVVSPTEEEAPSDEAASPEEGPPSDAAAPPVWVGTFDDDDWTETWGLTGEADMAHVSVGKGPRGGEGNAIRISNPGGGENGDRWGFDGHFVFEEAGIPDLDEAYFRYYVWFPGAYEFDTEGKMPGLQGVVPGEPADLASDSTRCTSGRYKGKECHDDRQFGARTMWKDGGMITYLNVISIDGKDRDSLRTDSGDNYSFSYRYRDDDGDDLQLRTGWNFVEQHVKLNTPGKADGVFEGWINGERGIRLTDVEYRGSDRRDLRISQWELVHFWGGPPSDYPDEPTAVFYDDFAISRERIGPRPD